MLKRSHSCRARARIEVFPYDGDRPPSIDTIGPILAIPRPVVYRMKAVYAERTKSSAERALCGPKPTGAKKAGHVPNTGNITTPLVSFVSRLHITLPALNSHNMTTQLTTAAPDYCGKQYDSRLRRRADTKDSYMPCSSLQVASTALGRKAQSCP